MKLFRVILDNSQQFLRVIQYHSEHLSELSNTTPNIFRSYPILLQTFFGVILDNFEKFSNFFSKNRFFLSYLSLMWSFYENFCEWYWTTPNIIRSYPIQLRTFFGVILDNSEHFSEWYWTTPNIFRSCPIPLQTFFGVVQYHSEQNLTTPKIFRNFYRFFRPKKVNLMKKMSWTIILGQIKAGKGKKIGGQERKKLFRVVQYTPNNFVI